jgi:hypothetical protein
MKQYRACDLTQIPMGQSQTLVHSPVTGAARVLPAGQARLLQACRTFATLDQHASQLLSELRIEQFHIHSVHQQLKDLAACGLLVSYEQVMNNCMTAQAQESPTTASIVSLGVPTRERPEKLRQCLNSFAGNNEQYGRSPLRIIVADGSHSQSSQLANQDVLAALKRHFGYDCIYIGKEEMKEYCAILAKNSGVPPEITGFALINDEDCPVATGINRNALLLGSIGELTLQIDDDVQCRPAPSPCTEEKLRLTSVYDPTEFWFFPEQNLPPVDHKMPLNFFALHEQLLGRSLLWCLEKHASPAADLDTVAASFLQRLGHDARVSVTTLGLTGELGTGSEFSFLRLDGPSRMRLLQSQGAYREVMETHQVCRSVISRTISDGTFLSGANLGLDNRHALPPFMPVQRNQDGIFGKLIRSQGESYLGYLPFTIQHERDRRWQQETRAAANVRSGGIMEMLVSSYKQRESRGAEENWQALGSFLIQLGTIPRQDFRELLQNMLWVRALQRISELEQLLARHRRQPDYWANDVQIYLSTLREALPNPDYVIPVDLSRVFGTDAALALMQRLVRRFGQLLHCWHHLCKTALQLRDSGIEPGRRV